MSTQCKCGEVADAELNLNGKPVCRLCAHNASHLESFETLRWRFKTAIPCPVTDGKGNVIPFGVYPNIDWT